MILEIDGTEDYEVLKTFELTEYTGSYRSIKYENGFYAIQKFITKDELGFELTEDSWVTVLVSAVKDKKLEGWLGEIYYGNLMVNDILECIKEADRSFNGKNWELKLFLSEDGDEYFTEIITKTDGETLVEQIGELYNLEREQRLLYLESYPKVRIYQYLFYIVLLVVILVIVGVLSGIL